MSHLRSTARHSTPMRPPNWYKRLWRGDILYFPSSHTIHIVNRVDRNSNVFIIKPKYSINSKPGTWSLYGDKILYRTPKEENSEDPIIEYLLTPPNPQHEEAEAPIVNPHGTLIRRQVFNDKCPWDKCGGGLFHPGCVEVKEVFPCFSMVCLVRLACPICYGFAFAVQDRNYLQDLGDREFTPKDKRLKIWRENDMEEMEKIWKNRCMLVERRRKQLGLPPFESL